jgi:hypothetical protein
MKLNGKRSLFTISPDETMRLLLRYLELRTDSPKIYGLFEDDRLIYWSLSKRDVRKRSDRAGLGDIREVPVPE